MKIHESVPQLFYTYRQTDRQIGVIVIDILQEYENA
jgi:hypothetical protein